VGDRLQRALQAHVHPGERAVGMAETVLHVDDEQRAVVRGHRGDHWHTSGHGLLFTG
jgi:hypothetical protein